MPPSPEKIVPVAAKKIEQIREAAREQLSPEEYERMEALLAELQLFGVTPFVNVELGKLLGKIEWELEIEESPEWAEALIECDRAFLGYELRDMFLELGMEPSHGHKKELCRRLYLLKHPKVVAVMEPFIGKPKVAPPPGEVRDEHNEED